MAFHTLTQGEMDTLGEFVFRLNNVQADQSITSTGHTPAEWVQEFNDALRCINPSAFGKNYALRPIVEPFPPINVNGDLLPPEEPPTVKVEAVPNSFVGLEMEVVGP